MLNIFKATQTEVLSTDCPLRLFNMSDLIMQSKPLGLLENLFIIDPALTSLLGSKMQQIIDPTLA